MMTAMLSDSALRLAALKGDAMPREATTKTNRDTWRAWRPHEPVADDQLLDREQLLEALRERGVDVSHFDIANWQTKGYIPHGERRRFGRITKTMYPHWMIDVIATLRAWQGEGQRLADIGPKLRYQYAWLPKTAADKVKIGVTETAWAHVIPDLQHAIDLLPAELRDELVAFARTYEATYGGQIVRIELRMIDGHDLPFTIPLAADESADGHGDR